MIPESIIVGFQEDLINQIAEQSGKSDEDFKIPIALHQKLAPAKYYLYEWQDYWLKFDGVDEIRLNDIAIKPKSPSFFLLKFKNQIGKCHIQAWNEKKPIDEPVDVEVISGKIGGVVEHYIFYQSLLEDLIRTSSHLPFDFFAETGRGVAESLEPPTPIFVYHFLRNYFQEIIEAINIVLTEPHRVLHDEPDRVPFAQVSEVDADVILSIFHSPQDWVKPHNQKLPLVEKMKGHSPYRVWQRLSEETYDTPENRFIRYFINTLLNTAEKLPFNSWYQKAPENVQRNIREFISQLKQAAIHPFFAEVGEFHQIPYNSQVLLRKEGYRELLGFWQAFNQSRHPLFTRTQQAMDVRDIATLYEIWVFFKLVKIIDGNDEKVKLEFSFSDEYGLNWDNNRASTQAIFKNGETLIYNHTYQRGIIGSYSLALRPDFVWKSGEDRVILDAKFRLRLVDINEAEEHDHFDEEGKMENDPEMETNKTLAIPEFTDLYKMHTYKDALKARAALSVYPGEKSVFYKVDGDKLDKVDLLGDVLNSCNEGIGAIHLKPE